MFSLEELPTFDWSPVVPITMFLLTVAVLVFGYVALRTDRRIGWLFLTCLALAAFGTFSLTQWAANNDSPAVEQAQETFEEELREQYYVTRIDPIGVYSYWGSFIHQAAAADSPTDAPTARVYGEDGVGHEYRVTLDNSTGEIDLYADGDAEAPLVPPVELRK